MANQMSEEKRFFLFLALTMLFVFVVPQLLWRPQPEPEQPIVESSEDPAEAAPAPAPAADAEKDKPEIAIAPDPVEEKQVRLGSRRSDTGFLMEVQFASRGASVRDVRLSEYQKEDRSGPLPIVESERSYVLGLKERPGVLEGKNWRITKETRDGDTHEITFETSLTDPPLSIEKTFRISKQRYLIDYDLRFVNRSDKAISFSYELYGPRGFVLEGKGYGSKLRDVAIGGGVEDVSRMTVTAASLAKQTKALLDKYNAESIRFVPISEKGWQESAGSFERFDRDGNSRLSREEILRAARMLSATEQWVSEPMRFAGVEGQYFCSLLIFPAVPTPQERLDYATVPFLAELNAKTEWSDPSVFVESQRVTLDANQSTEHSFKIYSGPRTHEALTAALIDEDLSDDSKAVEAALVAKVMDRGWFSSIADFLLIFLTTFHSWVGNWGVAIIMLTALVRLCMFPMSRKQAMSAHKMQALKPELDALKEKHKNEKDKLAHAQMDLWRKHGVNPLGGCLPIFIQMPIFIGLWQGLRTAIDLRLAPFLWINNLAAPDGVGIEWMEWGTNIPLISWALGPNLNILPIILMVLMYFQQKMFMPISDDPQVKMQQTMMTYMTFFFGFILYRLPSGVCVYYVISTCWSIAERKLLPKLQKDDSLTPTAKKGAEEKGSSNRRTRKGGGENQKSRGKGGRGARQAPETTSVPTWTERIREMIEKAGK